MFYPRTDDVLTKNFDQQASSTRYFLKLPQDPLKSNEDPFLKKSIKNCGEYFLKSRIKQ